jgi:ribosomal protein L13
MERVMTHVMSSASLFGRLAALVVKRVRGGFWKGG